MPPPTCWVLEVLGGCPCEDDILGKKCFIVSSEGCFEVQRLRPHWLVAEGRQIILPPESFPRKERACMLWADFESPGFNETSFKLLQDVVLQTWDDEPSPTQRAGPFVIAPLRGRTILERNLLFPLVPRGRSFGTLTGGFSLASLAPNNCAKRIWTLVFEVREGCVILTGRSMTEVEIREGFTMNLEGRFYLQALLGGDAPDGSHILLSLTREASCPEWKHWLRSLPPAPHRHKAWIPHPSDGFALPDPFKSVRGREDVAPVLPTALLEQIQRELVADEDGPSSEPKMFLSLLHAKIPRSVRLCYAGRRHEDYISLQAKVLYAHPHLEMPNATFTLSERVETARVHVCWCRSRCFVNVRMISRRPWSQPPVLAVLSLARRVESEITQVHWSRVLSARQTSKWIPRDGFVYPSRRQSASSAGIPLALSRILASELELEDGHLGVSCVYSVLEG